MTEKNLSDRFTSITATAGQTVVAWDFELLASEGMTVLRLRDGSTARLSEGDDYTFPGGIGGEAGGTLTLAQPAQEGDIYQMIGLLPETRQSDFLATKAFVAAKINSDLDRLTQIAQEHRRDIGRSWKAGYGAEGRRIDAVPPGHFHMADDIGNMVDGGSAADIHNAEQNASAAKAAKEAAEAAAASVDFVTASVPDDIANLNPSLSRPSINVLGYPMSPGASHDWVRSDVEPSHPLKEQSLDGQWWVPAPFTAKLENFGPAIAGQSISATLSDAIEFCAHLRNGRLDIPPGNYFLDAAVEKTLSGADYAIAIIGAGLDATRLNVVNDVGGIALNYPDSGSNFITLGGFRMLASNGVGASAGVALDLRVKGGGGRHDGNMTLRDILVQVDKSHLASGSYFAEGIHIEGASHPFLENVKFTGPFGPGATTEQILTPNYGFYFNEVYGPKLLSCIAWSAKVAFKITSSTNPGPEGFDFWMCGGVDCDRGLVYDSIGQEPGGTIVGGHFNCRTTNIALKNTKLVKMIGISHYQPDASSALAGDHIDIDLDNADTCTIDSSQFGYPNAVNTSIAINVQASCFDTDIRDCSFENRGIAVADQGLRTRITGPRWHRNVQAKVSGSGTDRNVQFGEVLYATIQLSANQTVPNNTTSTVDWDVPVYDKGGWFSVGTPGIFTVPSNSGIRFIELNLNLSWSNNSTGIRRVWIEKNGSSLAGLPFEAKTANASTQTSVSSGRVPAVAGDVFRVRVEQTSGGDLNIVNGNSSWFQIKAIGL